MDNLLTILKNHNINLTAQQFEAVRTTDGHILLSAVPGSGKTTVLIARLGHMIYDLGIPAEKILTITYTVAATNDMRNRFIRLFGEEDAEKLEFRTINGLCQKIILYYNGLSSKPPFEVAGDDRSVFRIINRCRYNICEEYYTENELKEINTLIGYAKNMLLTEEEIKKLSFEHPEFPELYKSYNREMINAHLMDYNDQLIYAWKILNKYPVVLNRFKNMYDYICVDEAQDTSKIQHMIISLLARDDKNLFMVGDEDQSIYGFRAAYPKAMTEFRQTYPDGKIMFLETNFRSDGQIVSKADNFIKLNKNRLAKNMSAARKINNSVTVIGCANTGAQYSFVANIAENCKKQTAVLYRNNETAVPIADILERKNIPYNLDKTDLTFFTSSVIRDIKDIISFASDMSDKEVFLRIYYKLNLFINKETALLACSKQENSNIFDILLKNTADYADCGYAIRKIYNEFVLLNKDNAVDAISRITSNMGYGSYLQRNNSDSRKISTLYQIAKNEKTASDLLNRLIVLEQSIKNHINPAGCSFYLSTIHSAKGLEYDTVYITDVYDGILPERSADSIITEFAPEKREYAEEERRLFYVAITRAKNNLYIFKPDNKKCSFINELQKESKKTTVHTEESISKRQRFINDHIPLHDEKELHIGMSIYHKVFGKGTVKSINKLDHTVEINFETGKTVKLSTLKITEAKILYK